MTLLESVIQCLSKKGKSLSDIEWVGCREFQIPYEEFERYAVQVSDNLDNVLQRIPLDIILVGKDFWIERQQYFEDLGICFLDECWEYHQLPNKPSVQKSIVSLDIQETSWTSEAMRKHTKTDWVEVQLEFLLKK